MNVRFFKFFPDRQMMANYAELMHKYFKALLTPM